MKETQITKNTDQIMPARSNEYAVRISDEEFRALEGERWLEELMEQLKDIASRSQEIARVLASRSFKIERDTNGLISRIVAE